jgi:hypothetical protein
MEPDNPLDPPGSFSDEELLALFKSVETPGPSARFVARTMQAVKREPLAAGRRALRNPLTSLVGWAAVIAGVALSSLAIVLSHPIFASGFSALVGYSVGIGLWMVQFVRTGIAVLDVFSTTGLAVTRAAATPQGTTGLALMVVVSALSLSALRRLLASEGEDSQWQELS